MASRIPEAMAGRLEWLMDLFAPRVYDDEGEYLGRDESLGVISREDLMRLLDEPYAASSGSGGNG